MNNWLLDTSMNTEVASPECNNYISSVELAVKGRSPGLWPNTVMQIFCDVSMLEQVPVLFFSNYNLVKKPLASLRSRCMVVITSGTSCVPWIKHFSRTKMFHKINFKLTWRELLFPGRKLECLPFVKTFFKCGSNFTKRTCLELPSKYNTSQELQSLETF